MLSMLLSLASCQPGERLRYNGIRGPEIKATLEYRINRGVRIFGGDWQWDQILRLDKLNVMKVCLF